MIIAYGAWAWWKRGHILGFFIDLRRRPYNGDELVIVGALFSFFRTQCFRVVHADV